MKVLVTGAAGRLGSVTVRVLLEQGFAVRATDRKPRADLPVPVEVVDLLDRDAAARLVEGMDAIVHWGNHPGKLTPTWQQTYAENVTTNANVFQPAAEAGVKRLLFASTCQTINGTRLLGTDQRSQLPYLPIDGEIPTCPGNPYALSKQTGEQQLLYYTRIHGCSGIALRWPMLIDRQSERWRDRWPLSPNYTFLDIGFAWLDFVDAAKLTAAILRADLPGFRVYHPATTSNVLAQPAAQVIERFYANVPLRRPIDQIDTLVDINRITSETGWQPGIT
jgi:nucleoside-diphosphate-sugar epimerase